MNRLETSPYSTSPDILPPLDLKGYQLITGTTEPIPCKLACQYLKPIKPMAISHEITRLNLSKEIVSPELFLYLYDLYKGRDDLSNQFGYTTIDPKQAALMLSTLSKSSKKPNEIKKLYKKHYNHIIKKHNRQYPVIPLFYPSFNKVASKPNMSHMPSHLFLSELHQIFSQLPPLIQTPAKTNMASAIAKTQIRPTELSVLTLIARGMTNKQISHALVISDLTVRNHAESIFPKLDAQDRTQAAIKAIQTLLLPLELI